MSGGEGRSDGGLRSAEHQLRLQERAALRIEEAAALVGLSERAFRDHLLPFCPKFRVGRSVRIPVRRFLEFVENLPDGDAADRESARTLAERCGNRLYE